MSKSKTQIGPGLGVYWTFQDLNNGEKSSLEEFRRQLSIFHRDAIVYFCGLTNTLLFRNPGRFNLQAHNDFVRLYLPTDLQKRMTYHPSGVPAVVFHRQQLLLLAKEALFNCNTEGRLWKQGDSGFAKLLLMANDHIAYDFPFTDDPLEKIAQQIVQFIPVAEGTGFSGFKHKIIRPYLMITRFLKPESKGLFFDVPALFERATGLPLTVYWAAIFAVITRLLSFDLATLSRDPNSFGIDERWYSSTKIEQQQLARFFTEISADTEGWSQYKAPAVNDFTCLKAKPLFKFRGRVFPIDFSFAASKCESGVFWNVHDCLDGRERLLFHQFWGEVFERYMNWLLQAAVDNDRNVFLPNPRYTGRDEQVCDAIVRCGPDAIFLEYKGNTFTAAAKYGGQASELQKEIESKLVGSPKDRKGPRQLAEAIARVKMSPGSAIEGLNLIAVRKIFPVLIIRDDIGGALHINEYLDSRFRSLINRKELAPLTVTPLFCFSADEIEVIASALKRIQLTKILEARYKRDPRLRAPFSVVENDAIGTRRELPKVLKEGFDEFADVVKNECFPGWREGSAST
jgi:hypothetical protein